MVSVKGGEGLVNTAYRERDGLLQPSNPPRQGYFQGSNFRKAQGELRHLCNRLW